METETINKLCLFFMAFAFFGIAGPVGINALVAEEAFARPDGPPPEAVSACEVQNVGEVCSFESPMGDLILGTCENVRGGALACVPEGHHPGEPGGERPPKPE